ncbi:MAG TPA: AMP-binding protein [Acidimicrobiales bacterium]|nr:AMP-binding protein [Acidimicrobiales bacterium]
MAEVIVVGAGVDLVEGAVEGLVAGTTNAAGAPHVVDVRLAGGQELKADAVVDASGRRTAGRLPSLSVRTPTSSCASSPKRLRSLPAMHPGIHAELRPDTAALVVAETASGAATSLSFRELDQSSNRLAQLLRRRGLQTGDVVAILMENTPAFLVAVWAAQRSGLYHTAISTRLTPDEVCFIVNDSGAAALIASRGQAEAAAATVASTPAVHTRLMAGGVIEGFEPFEGAVALHPADPLPDAVEGRELLYSSGTTGRPKGVKPALPGVPVGTFNVDSLVRLAVPLYALADSTVLLSPAPLYHAAPMRFCLASSRLGGSTVVMDHFDPLAFLRLVDEYRVTHALMVPTMFVRLLKLPEQQRFAHDLSSLKCVIHGAAPCPVAVKERIIAWLGPIVHEYYSSTEASGFTSCNSEEWLAHKGTVGKPLLCKAHVLDDDGRELAAGEPGTVWFDSGTRFEYHNDPETTSSTRNDRGWTTVGDIGYLDDDGYLYLTDRKAYLIITGGVNVYPQEAEDALLSHPKVMDAAVFGIPHDELGEEVKAVVQAVSQDDAGEDLERELIAWCRQRLAAFKCPRSVDFEAELPRHPTGKLYKRILRDRYWPAGSTGTI